MRIRRQGFFADIICDRRGGRGAHYCIVQQQDGSNEILHLSLEDSEEAAKKIASIELRRLAQERNRAVS
jgi:hypothetical protein